MCVIYAIIIISVYCYYPDELSVLRNLRGHQEAMGSPRELDHPPGGVAAGMWWVSLWVEL